MKKVLIFGTFDTLHPGHATLINAARDHGEVHVCLALDETIKRVKGREPINSIQVRIKNLEDIGLKAYPGDAKDRLRVVKKLRPDVILLGYDQQTFVDLLETYNDASDNKIEINRLSGFHEQVFNSSAIRSVAEDPEARFVFIDKESGISSMRVVLLLRKTLNIKKIGFAGTLDPLASGLLICGMSKATRLLDWWHTLYKTYTATARLGAISNTYDAEGMIETQLTREPTRTEVEIGILKMLNTKEQLPPIFSAKKQKGVRMYDRARRGEPITRKKHPVVIKFVSLVSYEYPYVKFTVSCSTGTYIRTLIHDFGQKLSVGAYMTSLRRDVIGFAKVSDALPSSKITKETVDEYTVSVDEVRKRLLKHFLH